MTAARIAFAVSNEFPDLTDDDKLAADALRRRGCVVNAALWDQPRAWSDYEAVVIRSCWDYHHRLDDFKAWLGALEAQGVMIWNPAEVMRWNMDKAYLSDLQDQGAPVLPSVWLPQGARADLAHILTEKNWQQAVMKPTVSAAADNTHSIAANDAMEAQPAFEQLLRQGGVIVQQFAPEIQTQGEWSFLFFGGKFSHAVLKQPKSGDFRVQRNYGGTVKSAQPSPVLIEQAGRILNYVESDLLYARVDVIERDGELLLMELELVEPHLFFEQDPDAPQRFATALQERLAVRSQ
jgi:glutathione synthase/RimK-type ligase-like ATP-grasp enzyme